MALNVKALRRADESLNKGNKMFMKSNEIGEDTIVRLLPPSPELNGLFYFEQSVHWVNKTPLISPSTFGDRCVIEEYLDKINEELELAKSKGKPDKDLQKLYDKVKYKKSNFMIPLLELDCKYDDDGELISYEVNTGGPRILQCGPQLLNAINKIVLSPKLLRRLKNVEDGITDRVEGYNLSLSRTGSGLDTQYGATEDDQTEIDAKYYKKIPSCVAITKKQTYTDEYLTAVLDNYFYGDDAPHKDDKVSRYASDSTETSGEETEDTETKDSPRAKRTASIKKSEEKVDDTPEPTEEPKTRRRSSRRKVDSNDTKEGTKTPPKKKSITDDLAELDD